MATLFRPTRPFPLPTEVQVVAHKGKPHARIGGALYPLSKDGTKFLKPVAKWAADVVFADGRRKRVRFSPNKTAAAVMLADLLRKIENEKAGVRIEFADHQREPLRSLLGDYRQHQRDKGNTEKQVGQVVRRCERVFDGCRFVLLADLDSSTSERWQSDKRQPSKAGGGISPQTFNHYVTALKSFGNWLVRTNRVSANPFRHLAKVNAEVDTRHVRRPLSDDEFTRLVAAAESGTCFRGLSGADRAMLYTVAGYTGLRASELASLSSGSFSLDADPPTATVRAGYSKHRREDTIPLHPAIVTRLRNWLAERPDNDLLWPGRWAVNNEGGDMIRRDLNAARVRWVGEARTEQERAERENTDFLAYKDRGGQTADFHALRHTFITNLVKAGVQPKDAKELARHSTITLTMDRYAHVGLRDSAAAVGKLPPPALFRDTTGAATGAEEIGSGGGGTIRDG
jgi:integrase